MQGRPARLGHLLEASMFIIMVGTGQVGPSWAQVQAGPLRTRNIQFAPNVRLGSVPTFEPAMTANPGVPGNFVAGFFDSLKPQSLCQAVFTTDNGLTWQAAGPTPLQKSNDFCRDPTLAGDLGGNVYYAYLDIAGAAPNALTDLIVAKSTDGGATFPTFSVATAGSSSPFVDKPYLAVDTQSKSPFKGSIYASYDFFTAGIEVVASRDGGSTWSAPVTLVPFSATSLDDGSLPVVAPDGSVYVFFSSYNLTFGSLSVRFVKSSDGGQTWSRPASIASGLPSPGEFFLKNADPKFGQNGGTGISTLSWPAAAIAPDGTIYVAWADFPQGSCSTSSRGFRFCINSDVRLAVSRNGGKSWTAPVKVSDETNASDQFFPWMATHPDGLLSIAWLDKRLDPLNENYDVFYTNTYDGTTFLPNVRVSTQTSIIGTNTFVGDYQGLAATADAVFPVWDDLRLGAVAIFTAKGTLAP